MNKILLTTIAVIGYLTLATIAYAADNQTLETSVSGTVQDVFSIEFYTEAGKVLYSTSVPFTTVDPTDAFNYPDGRAADDQKSDVGLIVISNQGKPWYLKIGIDAASPLLGKLGYNMGQPFNRNWESEADGSIGHGDWFDIPVASDPETMYTAGTVDQINTPLGTLATLSFKLNGAGLTPGYKSATVTYTLTETLN